MPWSPDLLGGQGSTHEAFHEPEILTRNSLTVHSDETKPEDLTGDNFSNSVTALRLKRMLIKFFIEAERHFQTNCILL